MAIQEALLARIDSLLATATSGDKSQEAAFALVHGTTTLVSLVHGADSPAAKALANALAPLIAAGLDTMTDVVSVRSIARGVLGELREELLAGITGSLALTFTGGVLADFLGLAKVSLAEGTTGSVNVAAVLAAAAYEDVLRRLATHHGLPHCEKLADVITALKGAGLLAGAQVGIAQSYLKFRNDALHADWPKIDAVSTGSCIAFVEQMLTLHF